MKIVIINFGHIHSMNVVARNLASGPYFTEAVAAVRANKEACALLGEPVRVLALRLGDKGIKVTTKQAQVHERGRHQIISYTVTVSGSIH